jgi:hypothetical protein
MGLIKCISLIEERANLRGLEAVVSLGLDRVFSLGLKRALFGWFKDERIDIGLSLSAALNCQQTMSL